MVVFTCNWCGESIHKPKVEKHYQFACRGGKSMTCVDCLKDFKDDYVGHTKCFTEDERYAAKGTYKNPLVKKGESKQDSWVEMIGNIVDKDKSLTPAQKNIFNTISQFSNVPRKKAKFMNFMLSTSGRRINQKEIESVWDVIEKYKTPNHQSQNGNRSLQEEKNNEKSEEPQIKKSKKSDFEETALQENGTSIEDKFSYRAVILDVLSKKQTILLKKLEKKVKNAYLKAGFVIENEEKFLKKVNKKIKKVENVLIEGDNVMLNSN